MKFGNHTLRRADRVMVGDKVCFNFESASYTVEEITHDKIGMIRHHHRQGTASNSYWPDELIYVEVPEELQ